MIAWWTAASAQEAAPGGEPMFMACRPHADALTLSALAGGLSVPDLPVTDAKPDLAQAVPLPRLVVDAAGTWTLDGTVVDVLPAMPQVLLFADRALTPDQTLRLFEALHAAGASPWVARRTTTRAPEGYQDPAVWPDLPVETTGDRVRPGSRAAWEKLLGGCKEGRALLEVGGDCATLGARWRDAAASWRCGLSEDDVDRLSGPLVVAADDPVSVVWLRLDPTAEPVTWYRGLHTFGAVRADTRWLRVADVPTDGTPIRAPDELVAKHTVQPGFPDKARRSGVLSAKCVVRVVIGRDGVPTSAEADGCEEAFAEVAEAALLDWRWDPPLGGAVSVWTDVAVTFRVGAEAFR